MNYSDFILKFPEFTGISESDFDAIALRIQVLFNQYSDFKVQKNIYITYLLIAHFLIIEGKAVSIGMNKPDGLVGSSSVGSVSVSMQTPPYKDATDYFFYSTPYGLEYLAYLNQVAGLTYVN